MLLAEDGGHFGVPGRKIAYKVEGKCWVNNHAHVLKPKNGIHLNFLCRHLEEYNVLPFTSGTTRLKLTKAQALRIPIIVPPYEEQKRIAAILDKADALRRKRRKAIQLADEFLRAVFLEMFGDIPAKKSKYPFRSMRPYVEARSGKSSKNVLADKPTGIPVYGGNGINGWAIKALYHEPVIVIGRVGQQCGITHLTQEPAWITDNAIVVKVKSDVLHPVFLSDAFQNS